MPPASPTKQRESRPLYAIGLRLLAMGMLSVMFALVKLLSDRDVNLVELLFYRQLCALPVVYSWIVVTQGPKGYATNNIRGHATRTFIGLTSMFANFGAVALLPLAESTTLGFTAPIFATILSATLLRERTGIHRWSAVLVGFVGVIIMAQPSGTHFPPLGLAVGIAAAIGVAAVSIVLRELSRTETTPVIVFWFSLLSIPPLGLMLLWYGQVHDAETFLLIIAMGTAGGLAQLLLTAALRWGPVSIVMSMDYSSILWATMLGWLLWNTLPGASTWIGAIFIVGSGLYIAWREHKLGQIARLRAEAEADMRA